MLTIFGKKKKDDSSVQIDTGTVPSQPPSQTPSMQPQAPIPTNTQDQPPTWPTTGPLMGQTTPPPPAPSMRQTSPGPAQAPTPTQLPLDASSPSEDTSLSRILQSLLQDIPTATESTFSPMPE